MNLTDELEKLAKLRKDGALTEDEFVQAKARLINQKEPFQSSEPAPENSLGTAANRYVSFQMVMGLLGFLIFIIFFFAVILPHLNSGPNFHLQAH